MSVALLWMTHGVWSGDCYINAVAVAGISEHLEPVRTTQGNAHILSANQGVAFAGTNPMGLGFILPAADAARLVQEHPEEADVFAPYFIGKDLNDMPVLRHDQMIINFHDWPEYKAASFPVAFEIVRKLVRPFRVQQDGTEEPKRWWIHGGPRLDLYSTLARRSRALACCQTSKYFTFRWVRADWVFSTKAVVFAVDEDGWIALLQSSLHVEWAILYGSSLRKEPVYTPSACYGSFPTPSVGIVQLGDIARRYDAHRDAVFTRLNQGPTNTYNRFHNPAETAVDVKTLRDLHIEMDLAVAAAYGWTDLPLDHGFHDTKQGKRFTISEAARREVLDRLLALNHARYAEEVAAGLHDKGVKKRGTPPVPTHAPAASYFDMPLFASIASKPPPPAPPPAVTAPAPSAQPASAEGAILAALQGAYAPMGKADLLARTGLTEADWKPAIDRLKADGRVEQVGERRGAKYRLAAPNA